MFCFYCAEFILSQISKLTNCKMILHGLQIQVTDYAIKLSELGSGRRANWQKLSN